MFVNERWLFTRDPNYSALNGNKKLFLLHIWSLMRGLVLPTRDSNQQHFDWESWVWLLCLCRRICEVVNIGSTVSLRDMIPFLILIPFAVLQDHVLYWSNGSMVWQQNKAGSYESTDSEEASAGGRFLWFDRSGQTALLHDRQRTAGLFICHFCFVLGCFFVPVLFFGPFKASSAQVID